MLLATQTDGRLNADIQPLENGPWILGEVLQELLERYEIDLADPAPCAVGFAMSDEAFAVCSTASGIM